MANANRLTLISEFDKAPVGDGDIGNRVCLRCEASRYHSPHATDSKLRNPIYDTLIHSKIKTENVNVVENAKLFAGIADKNPTLFRRLRVALGDPAAYVESAQGSTAIVRDLEMDRVRQKSEADRVCCPADFAPAAGLDADRETATAQALAEFCIRENLKSVTVDRTFPYIFAWHLQQAGVDTKYDQDLGVIDRRQKSEQELEFLAKAQQVTEEVMKILCETIANAGVAADGTLVWQGETLTSERVKAFAATEFMNREFSMSHGAIIATAPHVADCHHSGEGPLKTEVPVIVDLFPMDNATRYWGDCTRTVVNGPPTDTVKKMHQAVVDAKSASAAVLKPGSTGDAVHRASDEALMAAGYAPSRGTLTDTPSMQHGTGHGIGLDVHEPILLDFGGGEILVNEVFTIEPGLYGKSVGGVRVEDMLVVRDGGAESLNKLHEGLDWA
ncbi:M24 family metallopeptidase [Roseiconus lacunae]|uniref:M24 family metallopeptidase n=1 Tax=Roseiconus lacunae TaxID=2605694 RepID=A0ABT7PJV4_9BACT|nr:M24 family metallopeptidase [Roseiconus lacunae]MDM4016787.1 M24 family metallopeptidase [Roseiconus lacunae]